MVEIHGPRPRPIDPDLLGPLESPGAPAESGTLFRGDTRWFGAGEIRRRERIWRALASRIETVCPAPEHVIFVARAYRRLTVGMYLGLGLWAQRYHQVTLVVTDRRLIEVLHGFRGETLEPCTRSFPWAAAVEVGVRMSTLTLLGPEGKKFRWTLRTRGDRRAMALLVPRIVERLVRAGGERPVAYPVLHCPRCLAVKPEIEGACTACGSLVRSPRLATLLSLAFPGAGLAYVGHPFLALVDFVGEVLFFAVVAAGLATAANGGEIIGFALVGAFLLVATKLESIHISRLLAARYRPEEPARRARFQRLPLAGGALSVMALVGAGSATGRFVDVVDHDLDFADAAEGGWSGARARGAWEAFAEDPTTRSQWTHEDGFIVSVFAYPGTMADGLDPFVRSYLQQEQSGGADIFLSEAELPAGFVGHRIVEHLAGDQGTLLAVVTYFVHDGEGGDLHQLYGVIEREGATYADDMMWGLLEQGKWIKAVAPTD